MSWRVYRQDVWDHAPEPNGEGWEPFAAVVLDEEHREVIWWRRVIRWPRRTSYDPELPLAAEAAEPDAEDKGWIKHNGTRWPACAPSQRVDVRWRDGTVTLDHRAEDWRWSHCGKAEIVEWRFAEAAPDADDLDAGEPQP